MRQTNTYNVFIASPNDVKQEREGVHKVCQTLYRTSPLIKSSNIRFETSGWDDLMAQGGKPQDIIDIMADECDLFICIMHTKFGTPVNGEDSGTQWEFLNAYEKWATLKKPQIMLYFKEIKDSDVTSNREQRRQLALVEDFQDYVKDNELVLYKRFKDEKDFIEILSYDLEQFVSNCQSKVCTIEPIKNKKDDRKIIKDYYQHLEENYCHLDANNLQAKGKALPISLPEIFIPLYANDPNKKDEDKEDFFKEEKVVKDIEKLIEENQYILIEAGAGSGKTTLLKHLVYTISTNTNTTPLKEYFPILILLRDLNELFSKNKEPDYMEILNWYFKVKLDGIIDDGGVFIDKLIQSDKKILFLIDGFDELQTTQAKDKVANIFFTLKTRYDNIKLVFTSRAHGITQKISGLCSKSHVQIKNLDQEQIEQFVNNWFSHYKLEKTASQMISQLHSHEAIKKLIENPLMLTAICILYFDSKVLPEQRAELYTKFIENMIYRRFESDEAKFIENFIRTLSFRTHTKGEREFSLIDAVNVLMELDIDKTKTKQEWQRYFLEIEPTIGLLKYENGAYLFWHLSFQEYLSSRYLFDTQEDLKEAILEYIEDDWYKEMVELYIGYLSISNKPIANGIIKNLLKEDKTNPYKRWLLGARAMNDIIKANRTPEVVKTVKVRLEKIIQNDKNIKQKVQAGELLGKLGDTRDLEEFVKVDDITISKYLVTNSWYKEYLDDTKAKKPKYWEDNNFNAPNQPVVGISWQEAKAFCEWLSKNDKTYKYDLPTSQQWQKIAGGKEKREFPWGDKWDETKCNNGNLGINKTSSVGIFEDGNTPNGISDMAGNVWEWTNSFKNKEENYIVLRGSSWFLQGSSNFRCEDPNFDGHARIRNNFIGFRCTRI